MTRFRRIHDESAERAPGDTAPAPQRPAAGESAAEAAEPSAASFDRSEDPTSAGLATGAGLEPYYSDPQGRVHLLL
jgi:hypothetical protein